MNVKTAFLATAVACIVSACSDIGSSGSGGGGGAPPPGTAVVSAGVMTKGSVIVGGVAFNAAGASIRVDDVPKLEADLKDGMVVQVRGTLNGDGTGTAQQIEAQIQVRGTVTFVDPNLAGGFGSFALFGQGVLVDDRTLFSNPLGAASVAVNTVVEVHGLRDPAGNIIRATRIVDGADMVDPTVDEIRGPVSGRADPSATVFSVAGQAVVASNAQVAPAGATFGNGDIVEVQCPRPCLSGGALQATRVEVEAAEDAAFQPAAGSRLEVEGVIRGSIGSSFFAVGTVQVTTSTSTRFQGGLASDISDGTIVQAKGVWTGSVLQASSIVYQRPVIRLHGFVVAASAQSFTLNIAGGLVAVETGLFTSGSVPPVAPDCIEVVGARKAGVITAVVVATTINPCPGDPRPLLQAQVDAKSPDTSITLLGIPVNVANPTGSPQFKSADNQPISRGVFFDSLRVTSAGPPPVTGSLVKVLFNVPANTVNSVELED